MWSPQFECVVGEDGEANYGVGHELIDGFLEFIAARVRAEHGQGLRARSEDLLHDRRQGAVGGDLARRVGFS